MFSAVRIIPYAECVTSQPESFRSGKQCRPSSRCVHYSCEEQRVWERCPRAPALLAVGRSHLPGTAAAGTGMLREPAPGRPPHRVASPGIGDGSPPSSPVGTLRREGRAAGSRTTRLNRPHFFFFSMAVCDLGTFSSLMLTAYSEVRQEGII